MGELWKDSLSCLNFKKILIYEKTSNFIMQSVKLQKGLGLITTGWVQTGKMKIHSSL